jgi:dethiobiotin synthase
MLKLPPIVVVTGTGTGVGKTVATAALAAQALRQGLSVCVVKPVQTGATAEPPDVEEVQRLLGPLAAGLTAMDFVRLAEPLAPQQAARRAGACLPSLKDHAERIISLAKRHDLVLVEGAGGILVRLDDEDGTLADLAGLLPDAKVVIATCAGLGTLNVTELTVEALRHRGVPIVGLVIGRWPVQPGVTERENLRELPALTGVPLLGIIHEGLTVPPMLTGCSGHDT